MYLFTQYKGKNINGLAKLQKRVHSEKEFISELLSGHIKLQQSHVQCSNLGYLAAVFEIVWRDQKFRKKIWKYSFYFYLTSSKAEVEIDVIAVQKIYHITTEKKKERFEVDIVARNGAMWIKVKAMKPETIQALFFGNGTYGMLGGITDDKWLNNNK